VRWRLFDHDQRGYALCRRSAKKFVLVEKRHAIRYARGVNHWEQEHVATIIFPITYILIGAPAAQNPSIEPSVRSVLGAYRAVNYGHDRATGGDDACLSLYRAYRSQFLGVRAVRHLNHNSYDRSRRDRPARLAVRRCRIARRCGDGMARFSSALISNQV
jgi:hypothetical protein